MKYKILDSLYYMTTNRVNELCQHSYINHHVNGLNYLCLQRKEEETIKIYFIPDVINPNSGFLVNPHNHRYKFDSIVLAGSLKHIRFNVEQNEFGNADKHFWNWETKQMARLGKYDLQELVNEHHSKDSIYSVNTNEVHTLQILEPTIIGLIQYADTESDTGLYVPNGGSIVSANSKSMDPQTYSYYLKEVINLLK